MRVNTLAKNNIAIAKDSCGTIPLMRKSDGAPTQLPEFLEDRIGNKPPKMTATEVSERGDIRDSYISQLKGWPKRKGSKNPWKMSADAIVRLAKGCKEPPEVLFLAVIGKLSPGLKDAHLVRVLERFAQLKQRDKDELLFMLKKLDEMIEERLSRRS